jgi:hypothetical protein
MLRESSITECVASVSRKNWWLTGIIGILAVTHVGFELAVMGLTYVEDNLGPAISREDLTNILLFSYKSPRYDQLHVLEVQTFSPWYH